MFSQSGDSAFKYTSIENGESDKIIQNKSTFRTTTLKYWREALIIFLSIVCLILTFANTLQPSEPSRRDFEHYHLTPQKTHWKQFHWNTNIYSSENPEDDETINSAWDRIIPAHGIVAVDRIWAAQHNLPEAMRLPSNDSQGVYIIDAYHQIHCLTIIRKTLMEIAVGKTPSVPVQHSRHCFDSLLQYVVCGNSGDTLLYTWGRNQTGNNQLRKCIDWRSRRKWAHENTACYRDGDHPISLNAHFGHCKSEDDGIQDYVTV